MKAVVKYAPVSGDLELRDMPEPVAGPGEVKMEQKEGIKIILKPEE